LFRKLRLLSFLLLAAVYSGYAQVPIAGIVATPITGCAPLGVSFNDASSSGSPITAYNWNFGGVFPNVSKATSTFQNDAVQFNTPGTYIVSHTATNASGTSLQVTQTIVVNPAPIADFNVSKTVSCFPTTIVFTNTSTSSPLPITGSITRFVWDFGDGTLDSTNWNPSHIYHNGGTIPITLSVQNNFGCSDKASVKNVAKAITLTNGLFPDFTTTLNSSCVLPVTANFANSTTGAVGGTTTYAWDFGDSPPWGTTTTSPTHNYTVPGTYTVRLAASSTLGCTDTLSNVVNISASGNLSDFTGSGNVCLNVPVTFTNASSPAPTSNTWDFGDGSPIASGYSVQHTYTSLGPFNVTLTNAFTSCTGTVTKGVVVVAPPITVFTATNVNGCQPPMTTQFTDATPGATIWLWNFGDGTTSTLKSPSHIYNTYGSFTVTLTASTAAGCSNTLSKPSFVNIAKPVATITNTPAFGCAPFIYSPTISVIAPDGVATYAWDFGNGFTFNGLTPPAQTYAAGNYTVSLTITTNGGCSTTATGPVKVGTLAPGTDFTALPTSQCVGQPINFKDLSTGAPDQWLWDFGDGSTAITQNPVYSYTKPGTYDVSLTAYKNGCFLKKTKIAFITIIPPLADFNYSFACAAKTTYTFTDNSIGPVTTWDWDYGDLSPHGSVANPPPHIYLTVVPKTYNVTLTVSNGGCTNSITKQIDVNASTVITTPVNPVCNNTAVTFFTTGPPPSNFSLYLFDFGDGTTAPSGSGATAHTYTTPGNYNVTVTTTDLTGCVTTSAPLTMNISGPTVKFTTPTVLSCGPLSATFTDLSTPNPGSSVLKTWSWDFGDGGTATGQFPAPHNYSFQGIFPVKLKVTDNVGCSDSLVVPNYITVSIPVAKFTTTGVNFCPASNIKFTDSSYGGFNPVFNWDFKDGTTYSGPNPPLHVFPLVNTYAVSLTMQDIYGCTSTYTALPPINIDTPNASFTMSANFSACPPLNETFTFAGHYAASFSWDLGNGVFSTSAGPSTTYSFAGDYYPVLTVKSPGNCIATFTDHIHIQGPIGSFSYSPTAACDALDVTFNVTTSNSASFTWNFNDGSFANTTVPTIVHHYGPGSYVPFVTLIDAGGCHVNYFGTTTIDVDSIGKTFFVADRTIICDNGTVNFIDSSVLGPKTTVSNYVWDFGDGTAPVSGMNKTIGHNFTTTGVHNVSMTITTVGGCTGNYILPVTVAASPQIDITGLLSQCEPAILNFAGVEVVPDPNGPLTWSWSFGNGQTGLGQVQNNIAYPKAGEYVVQLIATNSKGCSDTTDTSTPSHLFIYPIPTVDAGADVTICDTSSLQLNATGSATSYNWDPPVNGTLSTLIGPSPVATSPVSTYFVVKGTTLFGCQARDTINVTVNTPVTITATGTDSVCLGQSTQLNATGASIYTWTPAAGLNNPNISNPLATPDASQIGNQPSNVITYTVTGTDNKKCYSDTKSVNVTAFYYPAITLIQNVTINVGSSYQINSTATTNIVSLNWTPATNLSCTNCLSPLATPVTTTKYTLTAINDGGCASTDSIRIQVICNGANFFVPNTFSPNGDGVNDNFIVNGVGLNVIPSITIYNRWGQIVFQKSNFAPNTASVAWDGTFNGKPAPPDVYIYTIQILCDNATLIPYHGNVTLIR